MCRSLLFQVTIKPERKSVVSVKLESPLVTEEGLIQLGEQPTEDVQTSFKLAPRRPETIEEFVTLEQPTETTVTLERKESQDEIQTSFRLAAQKRETIEEFVTLEQPAEASVTLQKPEKPIDEVVEGTHQEITLKKKKKSVSEIKPDEITIKKRTSIPRAQADEVQEVSFL